MLRGRERLHFYLLLVMILLSGLLDMVGVAAILPFLAVLTDPSVIQEQPRLASLYAWLEPDDTQDFLFLMGLGIFVVIVFGAGFKLFTMYALSRFSHMRKFHISQRLLAIYLRQPYVWFLSRHSSTLVKSLLQEVDQMVGTAMVPAMKILTQSVTVLLLLGLLILVEPAVALGALAVLGGSYFAIFVFARRMLTRLGEDRVESGRVRFRIASEALGSIKDVKLMGIEENYMRSFRPPSWIHARSLVLEQVFGELPRYALEAITFGGMIALSLILLAGADGTISEVLPVLGLFAVAGLRMLPAIQNIYFSATKLRIGRAVLRVIHDEMTTLEQMETEPPIGRKERLPVHERIELRGVRFSYPDVPAPVLDGLDLEIAAKTTVGIVGGTGAGKTTAVDILLGLLKLDEGALLVDGTEVTRDRLRAWQNNIGYVPQSIVLVDDTVAANIAFGVPPERIDMAAVEHAARLANLHDFVVNELEHGYEQVVGERGVRLSGGQRQRIGIARALYHDPEVLVLDEATSALDNITENAIMEAMKSFSHSKTIIMIAHRLTTVENCDEIFLLERGRCADRGSYEELIARNTTFRTMARVAS